MCEVSVVVPVYGCGGCVEVLHERLRAALLPLTSDFEVIYVDDRSPDGAWEVLTGLVARDPAARAFRLSRNFGQDGAITAGLTKARGDYVVVMDCDLQEPPEAIAKLHAVAQEGFDIVRTVRRNRAHSRVRRAGSRAYRYLTLEAGRDVEYSNMSLLSRKAVDAFLTLQDSDREYTLVLDWLGFSQAEVEIPYAERAHGTSSYTLRKLVRAAMSGMFFRTTVLLRLVVFLGFLIALSGMGLAGYNIYYRIAHHAPEGYTSLAVLVLCLSGFIIVAIGVVGLYVGRIFEQVKHRPLFLIDREARGIDDGARAAVVEPSASVGTGGAGRD